MILKLSLVLLSFSFSSSDFCFPCTEFIFSVGGGFFYISFCIAFSAPYGVSGLIYGEYIFGAAIPLIALLSFYIHKFFVITTSLEVGQETVRLIDYSKYGHPVVEELENRFLSEVKKGSYRYYVKHENGKTVLLPRFVYHKNERHELFLLDLRICVKKS